MRKVFIAQLLIIIAAISAQAQHKGSFTAGFQATPELTTKGSAGKTLGFTAGPEAGYAFSHNLWLTSGIYYSQKGFNSNINFQGRQIPGKTVFGFFEVPLMASVRTGKARYKPDRKRKLGSKMGFTCTAGLIYSFLYDGNYNFSGKNPDIQMTPEQLQQEGYRNVTSLNVRASFFYKCSDEVILTIGPSFKYSLTSATSKSSDRWTSIGLSLCIWYRATPMGWR